MDNDKALRTMRLAARVLLVLSETNRMCDLGEGDQYDVLELAEQLEDATGHIEMEVQRVQRAVHKG